jgi:ribosomal protein L11 methylase PrmA
VRREADLALRVIVTRPLAEVVGAVLMDMLGPFAEEPVGAATGGAASDVGGKRRVADCVALVFYPRGEAVFTEAELLALLPGQMRSAGLVRVEREQVPRDWVDGWKDHFSPIVVGRVRVRPPWEPPLEGAAADGAPCGGGGGDRGSLVEVVINPGLGFGTGLHPTTRGPLRLLQDWESLEWGAGGHRGPLVDVGTGSGILAIAAARLGWDPVIAFDNDPEALVSARENVAANGVGGVVQVHELAFSDATPNWFAGATVLANMTLEPVLGLLRKLARDSAHQAGVAPGSEAAMLGRPLRLVVAGILAGAQEQRVLVEAERCGFAAERRLYEEEWVSIELLPAVSRQSDGGV